MTTRELMETLRNNKSRELKFSFNGGRALPKGYHLTEVKNVRIEAIDCGGASDAWSETVIQLWLPSKSSKSEPMTGAKALKILEKVHSLKPMDLQAICRFEADADSGATIVYDASSTDSQAKSVTVHLASQKTQCKAQKRDATACGGSCAEPSEKTACCS